MLWTSECKNESFEAKYSCSLGLVTVKMALAAAFGNVEEAANYLMNPELMPNVQQHMAMKAEAEQEAKQHDTVDMEASSQVL